MTLLVTWGALAAAAVLIAGLVAHSGAVVISGVALFVVVGVLIFLRTFLAIRGRSRR